MLVVAGELNGVGGLEPTGMGRDDPPAPPVSNDGVGPSADVMNCVDAGMGLKWHGDSLVARGDAVSLSLPLVGERIRLKINHFHLGPD